MKESEHVSSDHGEEASGRLNPVQDNEKQKMAKESLGDILGSTGDQLSVAEASKACSSFSDFLEFVRQRLSGSVGDHPVNGVGKEENLTSSGANSGDKVDPKGFSTNWLVGDSPVPHDSSADSLRPVSAPSVTDHDHERVPVGSYISSLGLGSYYNCPCCGYGTDSVETNHVHGSRPKSAVDTSVEKKTVTNKQVLDKFTAGAKAAMCLESEKRGVPYRLPGFDVNNAAGSTLNGDEKQNVASSMADLAQGSQVSAFSLKGVPEGGDQEKRDGNDPRLVSTGGVPGALGLAAQGGDQPAGALDEGLLSKLPSDIEIPDLFGGKVPQLPELPLDDEEDEFAGSQPPDWSAPQIPRRTRRIRRNAPCPCGSGKKYKKCCLLKHGENGEHQSADGQSDQGGSSDENSNSDEHSASGGNRPGVVDGRMFSEGQLDEGSSHVALPNGGSKSPESGGATEELGRPTDISTTTTKETQSVVPVDERKGVPFTQEASDEAPKVLADAAGVAYDLGLQHGRELRSSLQSMSEEDWRMLEALTPEVLKALEALESSGSLTPEVQRQLQQTLLGEAVAAAAAAAVESSTKRREDSLQQDSLRAEFLDPPPPPDRDEPTFSQGGEAPANESRAQQMASTTDKAMVPEDRADLSNIFDLGDAGMGILELSAPGVLPKGAKDSDDHEQGDRPHIPTESVEVLKADRPNDRADHGIDEVPSAGAAEQTEKLVSQVLNSGLGEFGRPSFASMLAQSSGMTFQQRDGARDSRWNVDEADDRVAQQRAIEQLVEQISQMTDQRIHHETQQMRRELAETHKQVDSLHFRICVLQEHYEDVQRKCSGYRVEYDELESKYRATQQQLSKTSENLRAERAKRKKDRELADSRRAEKDERIASLEVESKLQQKELSANQKVKQQLSNAKEHVSSLESECDVEKRKVRALERAKKEHEERIAKMKESVSRSNEEVKRERALRVQLAKKLQEQQKVSADATGAIKQEMSQALEKSEKGWKARLKSMAEKHDQQMTKALEEAKPAVVPVSDASMQTDLSSAANSDLGERVAAVSNPAHAAIPASLFSQQGTIPRDTADKAGEAQFSSFSGEQRTNARRYESNIVAGPVGTSRGSAGLSHGFAQGSGPALGSQYDSAASSFGPFNFLPKGVLDKPTENHARKAQQSFEMEQAENSLPLGLLDMAQSSRQQEHIPLPQMSGASWGPPEGTEQRPRPGGSYFGDGYGNGRDFARSGNQNLQANVHQQQLPWSGHQRHTQNMTR